MWSTERVKVAIKPELRDWAPLRKTKRYKDEVKCCKIDNDGQPSVFVPSKRKSQLLLFFTRNLDLFTLLCLYTCIFWGFWALLVDLLAAGEQGGRLAGRGEMEEKREEAEGRQNSGREREEEDKRQMNDGKWKRNETRNMMGEKKAGRELLREHVK